MSQPTISDAKDICTRYRKRGAIILTFDQHNYHFSSYGFTRSWCDGMRHVVEQIAGLIDAEVVEIPDSENGPLRFDPVTNIGQDRLDEVLGGQEP